MKHRKGITLAEFKEKHYGPVGTKKRDALEAGYQKFKAEMQQQIARTQ